MSASSKGNPNDRRSRRWGQPDVLAVVAVLGLGVLASVLYASRQGDWAAVLGSCLMFAAAALAGGGVLGFLFGVPRALSSGNTVSSPAASDAPSIRYTGNTNLEQISDWLTKILLGATLTQLATIRTGAGRLFGDLAPALGGAASAAAFAGAVVVYFSAVGFIVGWLLTRLLLGNALQKADLQSLLGQAAEAERVGDVGRAKSLRQQAVGLSSQIDSVANRYDLLRQHLAPSDARTVQLESLVQEARTWSSVADAGKVAELFDRAGDGDRVTALALMQANPELADLSRILSAVTQSRSAFEQYHALLALQNLATAGLNDQDADLVTTALSNPSIPLSGDRAALATSVRQALTINR